MANKNSHRSGSLPDLARTTPLLLPPGVCPQRYPCSSPPARDHSGGPCAHIFSLPDPLASPCFFSTTMDFSAREHAPTSPSPFLLLAAVDLPGRRTGNELHQRAAPDLNSSPLPLAARSVPPSSKALRRVESLRKPSARHGHPRRCGGGAVRRRHLRDLLAVQPYFTGKDMVGTQVAFFAEARRLETKIPCDRVLRNSPSPIPPSPFSPPAPLDVRQQDR
jgi:hypothetical protein